MKKIAVVTVARSDYGVYRPLLKQIVAAPDMTLSLIVAGMHLMPAFGHTIDEILADGFEAAAKVELDLGADSPSDIAHAMGQATIGFADAYAALKPDLVLVLGDRFEMHAATVAAVPFLIPVAHLDGGALTLGAIDDAFRHSMTKLAHLHFVETEAYAARVIQMGELPERVFTVGALGLDNLAAVQLLNAEQIAAGFKVTIDPARPPLLVTFHPVTREYQETRVHMTALLAAIQESGHPAIFTYPNADTGGRVIIEMIEDFVAKEPDAQAVPHLGTQGYFSVMAQAAAMLGNSSSGIIEAASFKLPVVNIGRRQEGRFAPPNVLTVETDESEILGAIAKAVSPQFRKSLRFIENPYGDGHAAERIIDALRGLNVRDPDLIAKPFHDLPPASRHRAR